MDRFVEIRRLTYDDALAWRRLSHEAFGPPRRPQADPDPEDWHPPGMRPWGTFDDAGALVATVAERRYDSWFHGSALPTAGIADVAVAAEHRGSGLLRGLMDAVLAEARDDGAVVSTLFPTATGIYRPFGYELVGSLDTVELPTAALTGVRPGAGVVTRRATAADFEQVRRLYDTWAAAQNGPLTRRGESFPADADAFLAAFTGVTLACASSGEVLGFASWTRGHGYDEGSSISVADLITLTPDAARALWRMLGTFSSVTGTVRVRTSGADPARLALPGLAWKVVQAQPYMLRILDIRAALEAVRLPPLTVTVPFSVAGHGLDGSWTLSVADGTPSCSPASGSTAASGPTYTSHGLALAFAGTQSSANLRLAGHLTGPTDHDPLLDALLGGRQFHIRDYF